MLACGVEKSNYSHAFVHKGRKYRLSCSVCKWQFRISCMTKHGKQLTALPSDCESLHPLAGISYPASCTLWFVIEDRRKVFFLSKIEICEIVKLTVTEGLRCA